MPNALPPDSSPASSRRFSDPPAALQTLDRSRPLVAILAGLAAVMAVLHIGQCGYGLIRYSMMAEVYESAGWGAGLYLFQTLWTLVTAALYAAIALCLWLHQSATRDLLANRGETTLQTVLRYQHFLWQVVLVLGVLSLAHALFTAMYMAQSGGGL